MSYIVVDVESDNQSPATGSMVCFGAVLVNDTTKTFYGKTKPLAFCCGKNELQQLKAIIDSKLENDFCYGWIHVDEFITQPEDCEFDIIKRQKSILNTEPVGWD